jgi:hypothetical protein
MLLIHTQKLTPRISYVFKHICTRILRVDIAFTSAIEEFIAFSGPKLSYGKQPMGNELFIQSEGLLTQQGFEAFEISVKPWDETKCFFAVSSKSAIPFDIFAASFYLLTRYEEYLPHVKDAMGRFPASESLAFQEGFLREPVVDQWAFKFKEILRSFFPDLEFPRNHLKVHNLVEAGQPYVYKNQGFLRSLTGFSTDLWKLKFRRITERIQVILGFRRDPYDTFKWIVNASKNSSSKLTIFFLLGDGLEFSNSLNTEQNKFKMLVKYVADYKEVGLIFSFSALKKYEELKSEKNRIEEITNRTLTSSMNAQNLVSLPEVYRNLVELEIVKDFTMVYPNEVGFRASTCTPFLFYDLDSEIKTPLTVVPIAIDTDAFEHKYDSEINKTFNALYNSVSKVNGTFSMLFSNKDFTSSEKSKIWRSIFSEKL